MFIDMLLALTLVFAFTFLIPLTFGSTPHGRGSRRWRIDQSALFLFAGKVFCAVIAAWSKLQE